MTAPGDRPVPVTSDERLPDLSVFCMSRSAIDLPDDLAALAREVESLAQAREGDCGQLLQLLHVLEELHRTIYENRFQAALPDSRRELFALLQDIETNGRWPYIHRLQIQALLQNLAPTELNPGLSANGLPGQSQSSSETPSSS